MFQCSSRLPKCLENSLKIWLRESGDQTSNISPIFFQQHSLVESKIDVFSCHFSFAEHFRHFYVTLGSS